MILLLNYLPIILVAIAVAFVIHAGCKHSGEELFKRIIGVVLVTVVLQMLLVAVSNTYIPRGTVKPLANPAFEGSEAPLQDNLRKPERTSEEATKHLEQISDWKKERKEQHEH